MKIKVEMELEFNEGDNILITSDTANFLNKVFPVLESTCSYTNSNKNWKDFLGKNQGGINAASVESIEIVKLSDTDFFPQKAMFSIKWNNLNQVAYVITDVNDID